MQAIRRLLVTSGKNVQNHAYIWNTAAGMFSASESVFFSILVTRLIGLGDAGIITLGFAVGNLMATIGKSGGVRTLQVTDVARKYAFPEYLSARLVSMLLMLVSTIGYLLFSAVRNGYPPYKAAVLAILCAKFVLEAFEDVVAGECQKQGRLDVGARMFVFRSLTFMVLFAVVLLVVRQVIPALLTALTAAVVLEVLMLTAVLPAMQITLHPSRSRTFWMLLLKCLPLAICTFSFFYITNAPKYAIDEVMNDEVQACYSFIALPVFAIELLNNFIYQPSLVQFANNLANGLLDKVRKRILLQVVILCGLTAAAWGAAYLLGIPFLSLLFAADLTAYKSEMLMLMLTGGVLALMGYFSTVLTAMDHPLLIMFGYVGALVPSLFLYPPVILKHGIMGGVKLYLLLCILVAIYEAICIAVHLHQKHA